MKPFFLVLLGGLFATLAAAAGENSTQEAMQAPDVVHQIEEAFEGLVAAARSLDVERYLEYFDAERFTGLNEDGTVVHSLVEFASQYSAVVPAIESYRSLDFDRVKITVLNSSTAVLVNEYEAEVLLKSGELVTAAGAGTQVWSLVEGGWKLVSVSSSSRASEGP